MEEKFYVLVKSRHVFQDEDTAKDAFDDLVAYFSSKYHPDKCRSKKNHFYCLNDYSTNEIELIKLPDDLK